MGSPRRVSAAGLVRVAGLAALLVVVTQTIPDPDLWGHVRFGQDIVEARQIPVVDEYSFTTDRPWINHEWLAEVGMAAAYDLGGATGLVALKMLLSLGAVLLLAVPLRRGVRAGWARTLLLAFTLLVGVAPLTPSMRPQVFSLLCFSALLVAIASADAAPRRLWWVPPILAVWVNLHGGWIVGLGVFGVWGVVRMMDTPELEWRRRVVLVGVLSAAATLFNPYGFRLWWFILTTVRVERAYIVEWHSLLQLPILLLPWGAVTLLACWALLRSPRVDVGRLVVCGLLGVMSFMVARLIGFYALAVVALLASLIHTASDGVEDRGMRRPRAATALVGALVLVLGLTVHRPALACLPPSNATGDPAASTYLLASDLKGRLLVWFNWGEYAIWHLAPDFQVSIDGRRETVYSQPTIDAHMRFYENGPTAKSYLEELDPDYVWLPQEMPVNSQLESWGWQRAFETSQSLVWIRSGLEVPVSPDASPSAVCFP